MRANIMFAYNFFGNCDTLSENNIVVFVSINTRWQYQR